MDSKDIDTSFLDRVAKPPRQQHDTSKEDGRGDDAPLASVPEEDANTEPPTMKDTAPDDSDTGNEDRASDLPVSSDCDHRHGGFTGRELADMPYSEVIDEYHRIRSRRKGDRRFRKHFRTVRRDVNKMLKKDKEFNRPVDCVRIAGRVVMTVCLFAMFILNIQNNVFMFPNQAENLLDISYINSLITTNLMLAWYEMPNGNLLIIGFILGFVIWYASRVYCYIRYDTLRYRLIVLFCQDGVDVGDVKRIKSTVSEHGGVDDVLYYFKPEGGI